MAESILFCPDCGAPLPEGTKHSKLCDACRKAHHRQYNAEYQRQLREILKARGASPKAVNDDRVGLDRRICEGCACADCVHRYTHDPEFCCEYGPATRLRCPQIQAGRCPRYTPEGHHEQ